MNVYDSQYLQAVLMDRPTRFKWIVLLMDIGQKVLNRGVWNVRDLKDAYLFYCCWFCE